MGVEGSSRRRGAGRTPGPARGPGEAIWLTMLLVDGFIVGLLSVVFLDVYVGSTPVPLSAVIGGLVNGVLVYLAALFTPDTRLRLLPVAGWVIAAIVALAPGPGGDVLVVGDWRVLLWVVLGVMVPVGMIWSGRLPEPR
ncbi:hypothetical protein GCM10027169_14500 [Gordonia jinhuaensis]|uniref:Facilitated glucose transporter n=2 Tax=Gordonia jinhuaensis TaxID=1517702 RepID=A0A916WQQ2_9ACTN|nr:hypothetical protein GCM10011489_09840 [Gordonia jinhuaensis]